MDDDAIRLLPHVFHALCRVKEDGVHHKGRDAWPDQERRRHIESLSSVVKYLEYLEMPSSKASVQHLIRLLRDCHPQSAIDNAAGVWTQIDEELSKRHFFPVDPGDLEYYVSDRLAGDAFKENFPNANGELLEAGKCLALKRTTATVFHAARAVEAALKAWTKELGVLPANGNYGTWGKMLECIKTAKGSSAWNKNAAHYDQWYSFVLAYKNPFRDNTMHGGQVYTLTEAREVLGAARSLLRRMGEQLKE